MIIARRRTRDTVASGDPCAQPQLNPFREVVDYSPVISFGGTCAPAPAGTGGAMKNTLPKTSIRQLVVENRSLARFIRRRNYFQKAACEKIHWPDTAGATPIHYKNMPQIFAHANIDFNRWSIGHSRNRDGHHLSLGSLIVRRASERGTAEHIRELSDKIIEHSCAQKS